MRTHTFLMKRHLLLLFFFATLTNAAATPLDSLLSIISKAPVQEKIYLHIDNNCYFKGDTIWYKAYVVRADSLTYTDMSRITYVELVSPDGLVVERQNVVISPDGYGCGNFELRDTLYSGFYELRAYTRWMLNFDVSIHPHNKYDREVFYNQKMAYDFYRVYDTPYSRVVPVYEKPETEGEYQFRYIVNRPKTRLDPEEKPKLNMSFYPEGGHLIAGTHSRVAFEATNEQGEQVDVSGIVDSIPFSTVYQGRGLMEIDVPERGTPKVKVTHNGKDYRFDLPKVEQRGCVLSLVREGQDMNAHLSLRGLPLNRQYAALVLCRGALKMTERLTFDEKGNCSLKIDTSTLPTGVNDLIVLDEEGSPLADRLFFVWHPEEHASTIQVEGLKDVYEPYEQVELSVKAPANTRHVSLAVRDKGMDDPTFETGNIMTDLLLSSELKGYIPYPDYYFEADDEEHRSALDLLMMVQGWRRYNLKELTDTMPPRYTPEKYITIEGAVYKTVSFEDINDKVNIGNWSSGQEKKSLSNYKTRNNPFNSVEDTNQDQRSSNYGINPEASDGMPEVVYVTNPHYGVNHGGLKHEVIVESELSVNTQVAGVETETTNGGRFLINVPPFYGTGVLFISAHDKDISEKKKKRLATKGLMDEDKWPEYYVKRDLFYPVFAKKYSFYQCNLPFSNDNFDDDSNLQFIGEKISPMDKMLKGIKVKARRRTGRSTIDYEHPAAVYDAYDIYNMVTDYGLSFGKLDISSFSSQVATVLFGNMNSNRAKVVDTRWNEGDTYIEINYASAFDTDTLFQRAMSQSGYELIRNMKLRRLKDIRVFTDFELRNEEKGTQRSATIADVTIDLVPMPDNSKRRTYRDRRIIIDGMFVPDEFYSPDYNMRNTSELPKDYRRTLYWNPNLMLDDEGNADVVFFNNSKETKVKVSAAGLTTEGKPVWME